MLIRYVRYQQLVIVTSKILSKSLKKNKNITINNILPFLMKYYVYKYYNVSINSILQNCTLLRDFRMHYKKELPQKMLLMPRRYPQNQAMNMKCDFDLIHLFQTKNAQYVLHGKDLPKCYILFLTRIYHQLVNSIRKNITIGLQKYTECKWSANRIHGVLSSVIFDLILYYDTFFDSQSTNSFLASVMCSTIQNIIHNIVNGYNMMWSKKEQAVIWKSFL